MNVDPLVLQLAALRSRLSLWMPIGLIVAGTIGGVLNVLVFTRPSLRHTSCGIYFLVSSICNIGVVLTGQLSLLLIKNWSSFSICQLRLYVINFFAQLSRSLIILASFDRLMLCSSITLRREFWCSPRTALRAVALLAFLCLLLPLHIPLSYSLQLPQPQCRSNIFWLAVYDIVYQFVIAALGPSILMVILSIRLLHRLHTVSLRARRVRQRDLQLAQMLFGQVSLYVCSTLPYPINMVYGLVTASLIDKSARRVAIEILTNFFVNSFVIYLYFATSFFVYTWVAPSFRKELKRFLAQMCARRFYGRMGSSRFVLDSKEIAQERQ